MQVPDFIWNFNIYSKFIMTERHCNQQSNNLFTNQWYKPVIYIICSMYIVLTIIQYVPIKFGDIWAQQAFPRLDAAANTLFKR